MAPRKKSTDAPSEKAAQDLTVEGIAAITTELRALSRELGPLQQIEFISEQMAEIAWSLRENAILVALGVLAEHGKPEDRAEALRRLRQRVIE